MALQYGNIFAEAEKGKKYRRLAPQAQIIKSQCLAGHKSPYYSASSKSLCSASSSHPSAVSLFHIISSKTRIPTLQFCRHKPKRKSSHSINFRNYSIKQKKSASPSLLVSSKYQLSKCCTVVAPTIGIFRWPKSYSNMKHSELRSQKLSKRPLRFELTTPQRYSDSLKSPEIKIHSKSDKTSIEQCSKSKSASEQKYDSIVTSSDMTYHDSRSGKPSSKQSSKSYSASLQTYPDSLRSPDVSPDSRSKQWSKSKSASSQKYHDSSKLPDMTYHDSRSNKLSPEQCSNLKFASPQKYYASLKSPGITHNDSMLNKTSPVQCSKSKPASPQQYPDSSKSPDMTYHEPTSGEIPSGQCPKQKSALLQKYPNSSKSQKLTFHDSTSSKLPPGQCLKSKSASPQNYPNSSKLPDMAYHESTSGEMPPGQCPKQKSASLQKYLDSSTSPNMTFHDARSSKLPPKQCSKLKFTSLQKYYASLRPPRITYHDLKPSQTSPEQCSKSKPVSPKKYPDSLKSSDMTFRDSRSSKLSPGQCSKSKPVSPQKYPNSSKLPVMTYHKSRSGKSPEQCSKPKSALSPKYTVASKSSDMKYNHPGSGKVIPERCSNLKTASPQKSRDSSKSSNLTYHDSTKSPDITYHDPKSGELFPEECSESKSVSSHKYSETAKSFLLDMVYHDLRSSQISPKQSSNPKPASLQKCSSYSKLTCSSLAPKSEDRQLHLFHKLPTFLTKVRCKSSTSKSQAIDKKHIGKSWAKKIDFLFKSELNNIIEKFVNSWVCPYGSTLCPTMHERLQHHQLKCPIKPVGLTSTESQFVLAQARKLAKGKNYKENRMASINGIINSWLHKISPHAEYTTKADSTKNAAIQELIKSIISIENTNLDDNRYEILVNSAADHFLSNMHFCYLGSTRNRGSFNNGLKRYLVHKLLENRKIYPLMSRMMDKKLHTPNQFIEYKQNETITYDKNCPLITNIQRNYCTLQGFDKNKTNSLFEQRTFSPQSKHNTLQNSANIAQFKDSTTEVSLNEARSDSSQTFKDDLKDLDENNDSCDSSLSDDKQIQPINSKRTYTNLTSSELESNQRNSSFTITDSTLTKEINEKSKDNRHLQINPLDGIERTFSNYVDHRWNVAVDEIVRQYNYSLEGNNKNTANSIPEIGPKLQSASMNPSGIENSDSKIFFLDIKKCRDILHKKTNYKKRHVIKGFVKSLLVGKELYSCSEKNKYKRLELSCEQRNIMKEIEEWLKNCTFLNAYGFPNKSNIINTLLFYLTPYFHQPYPALRKSLLKKKIITIMKDLNIFLNYSTPNKAKIIWFADNLSNRLIHILSQLQHAGGSGWNCDVCNHRPFKRIEEVNVGSNTVVRKNLRHCLLLYIDEFLHNTLLAYDSTIKESILNLIVDNIELIRKDLDIELKYKIMNILKETNEVTDSEIEHLIDNILQSCKVLAMMISKVNNKTEFNTTNLTKTCLSGTVSIFTSQTDVTPSFDAVSSTPKKKTKVQRPSLLNPEQQAYTQNLKNVIQSWVDLSPPHFKYRKGSENMTELMIEELSAEICDHLRVEQIIGRHKDKEQVISFYIYKWLLKYEICEDLKLAEPYVKELVEKIYQITVPNMTTPQHGNRQDIGMIKQAANESWTEAYNPKVKDILEDEISIFMNEYPSQIFVDKDKNTRGKTVQEFVEKIEPKLINTESEKEVENEIYRWMNIVVKPKERDRVDDMAQDLINRLKHIPHDETIAEYAKHVKEERVRKQREKFEKQNLSKKNNINPQKTDNATEVKCDKTMTQFVAEYIEHNYIEEDPMTKNIYKQILISELNRLNRHALKDVYETKQYEQFNSEKLNKELMYIKEVSDWLKTIPMDSFYNTVENKDRAEFVIGVAKNIFEIEKERQNAPSAMDYDSYLGHDVAELLGSLPILPPHGDNVHNAVVDLLNRLAIMRGDIQPAPPGQGILKFLEEFMRIHGPEIANDKLKLQAWSARLIKEFEKLLTEGVVREKKEFEQKLQLVAKPGDKSVKHFCLELDYAKEIVDWLKNLELKDSFNESNIEELAFIMADHKMYSTDNKNSRKSIIREWVKRLPLNEYENEHIPILTMQLVNRIEKVNKDSSLNRIQPIDISLKPNTNTMRNESSMNANCCAIDDPGKRMVCTVEQWTDNLPLEGDEKIVKMFKDIADAKLYKRIAELSDAHLYKSDRDLFEQYLADEVDTLFNDLPSDLKIKGNKDHLKKQLIEEILKTCQFINDISAADNYRQELENAIQNFLPKPGMIDKNSDFELLKQHIIDKFLLENFDHADNTKLKTIIQKNIDKYADNIQKLNAVPINNEQRLESIYCSLYTVEIPDAESLKENIEELKIKCEIEEWFEALSVQPDDPTTQFRRYQKFMGLARKLRADKSSDKLHKAIKEFLKKELPQPLVEENIEQYSNDLQNRLEGISMKANDKENCTILKSPADIVIDTVEKWCKTVLLSTNVDPEQLTGIIKKLETKIIMKVSELNCSPNTLNSDLLYKHLLNEDIKKNLVYFGITPNDVLISQLASAIDSVRPLFIEEKSRYAYKREIDDVINRFVKLPQNPDSQDKVLHEEVKEDIIFNFFEFQCNKNNEEEKQRYKNEIVNVLTKYYNDVESSDIGDILIEANRLLLELSKIIEPSDIVMNEEIAESRMRHEISKFLKEEAKMIQNKHDINQVITNLSKELTQIEKNGQANEIYDNIENALNRSLKKLNADISSNKVKTFVEKLNNSRLRRSQNCYPKKYLPSSNDGYTAEDLHNPISLPTMERFSPIALPENSYSTWTTSNSGAQESQDSPKSHISPCQHYPLLTFPENNVTTRSSSNTDAQHQQQDVRVDVHFPSMQRLSKPRLLEDVIVQPSPLETKPQIQRYPGDTIGTWNSTQPAPHHSSKSVHISPTQQSPVDVNIQPFPPQSLPQMQSYPSYAFPGDTISSWDSTRSGAQHPPQDVSHIPPTQQSPINVNIQTLPPQDSSVPHKLPQMQSLPHSAFPGGMQTLPQMQSYPSYAFPGESISTWESTQSGAQAKRQNVSVSMNIPPTQRSSTQSPIMQKSQVQSSPTHRPSTSKQRSMWTKPQPLPIMKYNNYEDTRDYSNVRVQSDHGAQQQNGPVSVHIPLMQPNVHGSPTQSGPHPLQAPAEHPPPRVSIHIDTQTEVPDRHRAAYPTEPATRSLGINSKPTISDACAQSPAPPYFRLPCMALPVPQGLRSAEGQNDGKPQRAPIPDIDCDCEHCMGMEYLFTPAFFPSCESLGSCFPPMSMWMPPCRPPFNL